MSYAVPKLPYAYDALEPAISKQIMELHHGKHHATYVTNLNAALKNQQSAFESNDIPAQIDNQKAINFNGGGHINHSLFWANLAPTSSNEAKDVDGSAPKLSAQIKEQYGDVGAFKEAFNKSLLGLQGSGWGWLVKENADSKHLLIITSKDQDPVPAPYVPIIGVDMWEHAYYLQYLNGKAQYVQNIWSVINWKTAEERYNGGRADSFKGLKAVL